MENDHINQIVQEINQKANLALMLVGATVNRPQNIIAIPSFWYKGTLNYKTFMVPGILVLWVMMIALFLSGMNIVREKKIATLEQINVTPSINMSTLLGSCFPS